MTFAESCACHDEECGRAQFEVSPVGAKRQDGMLQTIERLKCQKCGSEWLIYSTDDESRGGWGKWFRASAPPESTEEASFDECLDFLAGVRWHFYGGSYYRTSGERTLGAVPTGREMARAA